jgi:hypothetical protein
MTSWAGADEPAERVQKAIEAAGFRLLQSYLAAARLCPHRPVIEEQPAGDPSYLCTFDTAGGAARATFIAEYTEGPVNYQLTFECYDPPYGPESLVVLMVAISDITTTVLATFASLQYENIVLIYNTTNTEIDALPPVPAQLQAVLAFLRDPAHAPGSCAEPDA